MVFPRLRERWNSSAQRIGPDGRGLRSQATAETLPGDTVSAGTILLVGDNALVRRLVGAILSKARFEVIIARSAKEAMLLEVSFAGTIHLLISDIMMPDMCGPDLAKAMKERRPDMRVILISRYADGGLLVLNFGWHFIRKPLLPEGLLDEVNEVLHSGLRDQGTDHFDERKARAAGSGRH